MGQLSLVWIQKLYRNWRAVSVESVLSRIHTLATAALDPLQLYTFVDNFTALLTLSNCLGWTVGSKSAKKKKKS